MKFSICLVLLTIIAHSAMSQESKLPYYQIPDHPESYTAEAVAARMIDGLGYRYYWGTEGLREEDLDHRPSEGARSSLETIKHIHGLSLTILNGTKGVPNKRSEPVEYSFEELRTITLNNIKEASENLKTGTKLTDSKMIFGSGERSVEYEFWFLINGPIADAIWHVGQVVTFRRSSGNPFNSKASLLQGKLRD